MSCLPALISTYRNTISESTAKKKAAAASSSLILSVCPGRTCNGYKVMGRMHGFIWEVSIKPNMCMGRILGFICGMSIKPNMCMGRMQGFICGMQDNSDWSM